jgi:hypothetical protein
MLRVHFSSFAELGEDGNKQLQNIMMQLRKAANHPLLHRTLYTTETLQQMSKAIMREPEYFDANQQYIFEDMEVMSDFELHKLCRKFKVCGSPPMQSSWRERQCVIFLRRPESVPWLACSYLKPIMILECKVARLHSSLGVIVQKTGSWASTRARLSGQWLTPVALRQSLKKFRLSKDVVFASAKLDYLRQILPAMHENVCCVSQTCFAPMS